MSTNPLDIQIGGNHYKGFAMQPIEFIHQNNLGFVVGCIIKRICRYDQPTGKGLEDLRKIDHELDLLIDQVQKGHIEPQLPRPISTNRFFDININQLSDDQRAMIELVALYNYGNGVADLYQAKDLCRDILERHHVQPIVK